MQTFVPLSDLLLYHHPERIDSPCRPYQPGMICIEWLQSEEIELTASPSSGVECEDRENDC
jgi:hypothetical protein